MANTTTDPLTGLLKRDAFDTALHAAFLKPTRPTPHWRWLSSTSTASCRPMRPTVRQVGMPS